MWKLPFSVPKMPDFLILNWGGQLTRTEQLTDCRLISIFNRCFCNITFMFGCLIEIWSSWCLLCKNNHYKVYRKIGVSALWTKTWKRISPFNAVQLTGNGGAFAVWPTISPEKSLCCGIMMGPWPNFILVLVKFYPKLWVNNEPLNFLTVVGTNYCELKSFSDMMVLWSSPSLSTY